MKIGDRVKLKKPQQTRSERDGLRTYPRGSKGTVIGGGIIVLVVRMDDGMVLAVCPENLRVCREVAL